MQLHRRAFVATSAALAFLPLTRRAYAVGYVGHKLEPLSFDVEQSNGGTYADKQFAYYKHFLSTSEGSESYIALTITNDKSSDGDHFGFLSSFADDNNTVFAYHDFRWGINARDRRDEVYRFSLPKSIISSLKRYIILWYRFDKVTEGIPFTGTFAVNADAPSNFRELLAAREFSISSPLTNL